MISSTNTQRAVALLFFLTCNGVYAELSPMLNDDGAIQSSQLTAIPSQNARGLNRSSPTDDTPDSIVLSEDSTPQISDRRGQRPDYSSAGDGAIQTRPRSR